MTTPRTFWTIWGAGFAVWGALLVVFAPWDLEVSLAVVDREATLGRLVALAGEWPAWAATALCVFILILGRKPDSSLRASGTWASTLPDTLHSTSPPVPGRVSPSPPVT